MAENAPLRPALQPTPSLPDRQPFLPAQRNWTAQAVEHGREPGPISCLTCRVRELCLPGTMSDEECASFEHLVIRRQRLLRAEFLRQMNEPVHDKLYAVHSGQLKCYQVSRTGEQRITALPSAGHLLGLDRIDGTRYSTAVAANSRSIVCELNYAQLLARACQFTLLARRIEFMLSKELARQQAISLMLRSPRAEQKLAIFLLQSAWAGAQRGGDGIHLELQLSRRDIADYLGLADATIARLLQRFSRIGCLAVSGRHLALLDAARLRGIARGDSTADGALGPRGEHA
jgi:CRP/FNR family transcriptional regulator, anaerobic regulatory protein